MSASAKFARWLFLAIALSAAAIASAQTYPTKPIRIIIPFQPGSLLDVVARLTGDKVGEALGQKAVVEFMGGGNGIVGAQYVAKAAPDGYTLLFTTPSSQITPVYLMRSVPYDPLKDFTPIALTGEPLVCLAVTPSRADSFTELMAQAKRNPGKMSFSSTGNGSVFHLIGEQVNQIMGINIVHVAYKNAVQAFPDLASGQLEMSYTACSVIAPFVKSGKVKLLVQILPPGMKGRSAQYPDVPAITEVLPDYQKPPSWFAYLGPARLPRAIVNRLNAEIVKSLDVPEIRSKLEESGLYIMRATPEQFEASYRAGFDIYAGAVKAAGLKPE
jgi:tripartite-type tricarboxylate transporter receptor subunit TctC